MLIERLTERRGEEIADTGTLNQPSVSLLASLNAGATMAGVSVSESTADGIPAVYSCVRAISETVGQLPLKLYRRTGSGKAPDPAHPLYALLHDLPNPEMTSDVFREVMTRHLALWGNAYAEVVRDPSGRVRALWPLHPAGMTVDRDGLNRKRWTYRVGAKTFAWAFDPYRPPILHLMINSEDGVSGRSPIRVLRESLGLTLAAQTHGAAFYGNGAMPGVIAIHPKTLSDKAKDSFRKSWNKRLQGPSKSNSLAILEEGIKVETLAMPHDDAQFLETRSFQIEEAARIYRVPLFMIQHMTKSTSWGSGIEQMGLGFVNFTMMPWLMQWQHAIARDLLTVKSFETHTAIFVVNALVRGDIKARTDAYAIQIDKGIRSPNEVRELEDLNARTDPFGDEFMVPINNTTPASLAAVAVEPDPTPEPNAPEPKQVM